MLSVKGAKPSRIERTRQTHRRMLDGARDLFLTQGYAATTMEQIAAPAGVAVQTVYYTFGTKGQLLCEVVEVTAAGEDEPVPVAQQSWGARPSALRRPSGFWHWPSNMAPPSTSGLPRSGRP